MVPKGLVCKLNGLLVWPIFVSVKCIRLFFHKLKAEGVACYHLLSCAQLTQIDLPPKGVHQECQSGSKLKWRTVTVGTYLFPNPISPLRYLATCVWWEQGGMDRIRDLPSPYRPSIPDHSGQVSFPDLVGPCPEDMHLPLLFLRIQIGNPKQPQGYLWISPKLLILTQWTHTWQCTHTPSSSGWARQQQWAQWSLPNGWSSPPEGSL